MNTNLDICEATEFVISEAKKKGADSAESKAIYAEETNVSVRLGKTEKIENSNICSIDIRFLKDNRQVILSSSEISKEALEKMVSQASDLVKMVPASELNNIKEGKKYLNSLDESLDLYDSEEIEVSALTIRAKEEEESALSVKGITNSEGSEISVCKKKTVINNSRGFFAETRRSYATISVSVIGGFGPEKETDYASWSKVFYKDLPIVGKVGQEAAYRTLRRLNSLKISSGMMPVVFESRIASSLLGHFAAAINGQNIVKGVSFLKDKMGEKIFASDIDIVDNPREKRGLRSRYFDDEGTESKEIKLINRGFLSSWFLDNESSFQLKQVSTGHASRSIGCMSHPRASNLFFTAGGKTPQDLIKDIKRGVFVTDLFGQGVNLITGDYSRGATGFLIEEGELTHPVHEITIAGNLLDMFKNLQVANDLEHIRGIDSPTLRIEEMGVSGS